MKKSRRFWAVGPLMILSLATARDVFAFNIDTHRILNDRAAVVSSLDGYLKQQLGLSKGLLELFNERPVREWIRLGGEAEDEAFGSELIGALFRSRHHFHNPLLPWNQAGLNRLSVCFPLPITGKASVQWAQDPNQGLSGQAAWADARQSYRDAERVWLDPTIEEPAKLLPLLTPYPARNMEVYPVSTWVNNPAHDSQECIQPLPLR
jgi:hypothetical protein